MINTDLLCHIHLHKLWGSEAAISRSSSASGLMCRLHHNWRDDEPVNRHVPVKNVTGERWAANLWQEELNRCHRCTCGMPGQDMCHWLQNKLTTFLPMITQLLLNKNAISDRTTRLYNRFYKKKKRTCAFPRGLTSIGSNTQIMFP